MLSLSNVSVHYGRAQVLFDVTLEVAAGEIVALIGANGAGKSTLVNAISGFIRPSSGEISFDGTRLDALSPEGVVQRGVVQVAEGRQLFPSLTVEENLLMGAFTRKRRAEIQRSLDRVLDLFPILRERRRAAAQSLSGGQQQMLAIGRALMAEPNMMIFDEPSLGLAPIAIEQIFQVIRDLNRDGMPILLIEQNVSLSLELSSHAHVLEKGRITLSGRSAEVAKNSYVETAYLGL
jgi:branched-chain amino acid transport system ATP-binding protein